MVKGIRPGDIQKQSIPFQPDKTKENKGKFEKILKEKLNKPEPTKFSGHAIDRMQMRKINFTSSHQSRLNQAVDKLEQKGGRESLVLMDDLALIVSVKNRMVITAVDGKNVKENVFTNIDSAVIV